MNKKIRTALGTRLLAFALGCAGLVVRATGEPRPLSRNPDAPAPPAVLTNAPLREIKPGIFQLGGVTLDKARRTISFAASVNMTQGPAEYLLVHETGKIHESVLRTAVQPIHIHLGALLLRSKSLDEDTNNSTSKLELMGLPATIQVSWKEGSSFRRIAGEDLVFNLQTKAAMERGHWTYHGARVVEGVFLAQRDGSIASVITDPDALLNGMRPGRDHDDLWQVNANAVPPLNTPVEVVINFVPAQERKNSDKPSPARPAN